MKSDYQDEKIPTKPVKISEFLEGLKFEKWKRKY